MKNNVRTLLRYSVIILFLLFYDHAYAQYYSKIGDTDHQLGVNTTLSIGLRFGSGETICSSPYFKLNVNSGAQWDFSLLGINTHLGLSLKYNTLSTLKQKISAQIFGGAQVGANFSKLEDNLDVRYYHPFYSFSDLSQPAVYNLYKSNVSLGTQYILLFDKKGYKHQRVGLFQAKIGNLSMFYQNDGVPHKAIYLGDGQDRYYTSSILLSYQKADRDHFNPRIFAGYNRFTGHTEQAYTLANALGNTTVHYMDDDAYHYNVDYLTIGVGIKNNIDLQLNVVNAKYQITQIQKFVHRKGRFPYHIDNSRTQLWIEGSKSNIFNKP